MDLNQGPDIYFLYEFGTPESWAQAHHHDTDIVGTELLQGMVQKDLTGLGGTHHILDQIYCFLVTADIPQLVGQIV